MKKFQRLSLIIFLFLIILPVNVLAHPGRTDGKGGHTNSSTGEYHYHHGYSAHDHYDIDGDGIIDCPYDFHDKTNSTSRSHTSNSVVDNDSEREKTRDWPSIILGIIMIGTYLFIYIVLPIIGSR